MPTRRMKSGHWQITFKLPGQPRYRKVHPEARLKSDAELIETRLKQQVFDGKWKPTSGEERFSDFAETYLVWARQHKRSYEWDEMFVRQILPTFGKLKLGDISTALVQQWWTARARCITKRKTLIQKGTLNHDMRKLARIFSLAVEWGKLERNPCKPIKKYAENNRRTRVLTVEEERRILEVLDRERPLFGQIVRLALLTGMRRGEMFKLKCENLDLEIKRNLRGEIVSYGQINIPAHITKSGKARVIPLAEEAWKILTPMMGAPYHKVIRGMAVGSASGLFTLMCRRAHVEGAVFHSLRHTFGTRLADRNVHPGVIRDILGHATMQMTDVYIHPDQTMKQRAIQSLSTPSAEVYDIAVAKRAAKDG